MPELGNDFFQARAHSGLRDAKFFLDLAHVAASDQKDFNEPLLFRGEPVEWIEMKVPFQGDVARRTP